MSGEIPLPTGPEKPTTPHPTEIVEVDAGQEKKGDKKADAAKKAGQSAVHSTFSDTGNGEAPKSGGFFDSKKVASDDPKAGANAGKKPGEADKTTAEHATGSVTGESDVTAPTTIENTSTKKTEPKTGQELDSGKPVEYDTPKKAEPAKPVEPHDEGETVKNEAEQPVPQRPKAELPDDTTDIAEIDTSNDGSSPFVNDSESFGPVIQALDAFERLDRSEIENFKESEHHHEEDQALQYEAEETDHNAEAADGGGDELTITPSMLKQMREYEIRENTHRQKAEDEAHIKNADARKNKKKSNKKAEEEKWAEKKAEKKAKERQLKLTEEQREERFVKAEQARYVAAQKEAAEKAGKEAEIPSNPDKLAEDANVWTRQNPLEAELKKLGLSAMEYEAYLFSISDEAIEALTELTAQEQQEALKDHAEDERVRKAADAAAFAKNTEVVESSLPEAQIEAFLEVLSPIEIELFNSLPRALRDRMVIDWLGHRSKDLLRTTKSFFERLTPEQIEKFKSESPENQHNVLQLWRNGGSPPGYEYSEMYTHSDPDGKHRLQAPSYRIFDNYGDEEGFFHHEIVTEHNLMTRALTKAERKTLIRKRDRWIYAPLMSRFYNAKLAIFQYEKAIAEENKHMQEFIRGIVDTGPDENIRLVFAQKHGDTYLDYNGNEVDKHIVRKAQKRALAHPSLFQAYCHYELSKREEPEQMKLWEEIFEMMAHHNYDRYSMFGVVVGLQFMNKPSYLAYKNASIEWAPIYKEDAHGHAVTGDDGNPEVERYTADSIWEHRYGKKVRKRDPDGLPVEIGEIVRSNKRARFATIDLVLSPGDQEYDEKLPDGSDKYPMKYKTVRDAHGNELYKEEYKSKKILKLKRVSFAHEIAGKFMSYQYGFRSADVAVMLDEGRHASATMLRLARDGKFNSREFQEAAYLMARLKMIVDTSRLGGASSPEGKEAGGDESAIRNAQMDAARRKNYDDTVSEALRNGATQKDAEAKAAALTHSASASGSYPPRISGTAEANVLFLEVAVVADKIANIFPHIVKIRKSDMEAIQSEFRSNKAHH